MTYGLVILGVSNSMLRDQRRVAAAIAAPASGTGGQNIDAALILADGGPSGLADPAFDAHILPIGEWATAIWEDRLPRRSMQKLVASAIVQLDTTKKVWVVCKGPAAAFVATCRRLQWTVQDAATIITDDGMVLHL